MDLELMLPAQRSSDSGMEESWSRGMQRISPSLTTVSNKDCSQTKVSKKYPKRCSDIGIEKSCTRDATDIYLSSQFPIKFPIKIATEQKSPKSIQKGAQTSESRKVEREMQRRGSDIRLSPWLPISISTNGRRLEYIVAI